MTTSSVDPSMPSLKPFFPPPSSAQEESPHLQAIIKHLGLQPHVEGGYFVETDRDKLRIPNPFSARQTTSDDTRAASTTIHYLLTPASPLGAFHRNRGRTVHTLHRGRGRYVIIHADEVATETSPGGYDDGSATEEGMTEQERWIGKKARVETFIVGPDALKGEKLQWIVEGGKFKSSFLLPDLKSGEASDDGLLISETVVPGFEFADHDFMRKERLDALVTAEQAKEMGWMLRRE